jgi:hypothetical protein
MSIFRIFRSIPFALMLLSLVQAAVVLDMQWFALVATSTCNASQPPSKAYSVTVCFTSPANDSTLTEDVKVTATGTMSSTITGIQRMVFYLNGTYLLTDYQSPYTFSLPTANWVDGTYTLSAEAFLRDGFTSQQASVSVQFKNGVATQPLNKNQFKPTSGTTPANGEPFVMVAAGDGASGENNSEKVVNLISSINPNLFLYLGDVYEKGSSTEFTNWYGLDGSNFGLFRSITDPTVGNHEYTSEPTARGYFNYWDNIPNYYSFDADGWHFVSLNSNFSFIGVNGKSAQYLWLASDLAAHANACTIVYYHHPLFNIGPEGETKAMAEIWALMAKDGVSIVLNGHDHDYQRWVPLDGNGQPSPTGITEFVAGGAGHGLQKFNKSDDRVAYSNDANPTAFGVLKFILHPSGVDFSYINDSKATIDSGTIPCAKVSGGSQGLSSASSSGTATPVPVDATQSTPGNVPTTANANVSGKPAQSAGTKTPSGTSTPVKESTPSLQVSPTAATDSIPILFTTPSLIALSGLAAIILIAIIVIARRHF